MPWLRFYQQAVALFAGLQCALQCFLRADVVHHQQLSSVSAQRRTGHFVGQRRVAQGQFDSLIVAAGKTEQSCQAKRQGMIKRLAKGSFQVGA